MPQLSTDEIYTAYRKFSGDPCKQVVCIIFDYKTKNILSVGTNTVLRQNAATWWELMEVDDVIKTPAHPAKKLLMVHAEAGAMDSVEPGDALFAELAAYVSLQPCVNCLKSMIDFQIQRVYWKENNRHQQEQEEVKDFIKLFLTEYEQQDSLLLVPTKEVMRTVLDGI